MSDMLKGQVGIVSGGLGDIGRAIALELARHGAHVAVCDIAEPEAAHPLITQLRALRIKPRYDKVDVADPAAVARWCAAVEADLGLPTLIVPNAAIVTPAKVQELTPEIWRRELSVNLDGAFFMAHRAVQALLQHGRPGRVVFVGSWAGHQVHQTIPAYCVSKAGLRMLCKCLAAELAPHQILVNEVAPGYVDAGLTAKLLARHPETRERTQNAVPVRMFTSAEEVARQVIHLCDPDNRQMTGSTLLMDGGLSLFGMGGQGR